MSDYPPAVPPLVACVNASENVTDLLAEYLRLDGFRAVPLVVPLRAHGEPLHRLISDLRPDACIYTIGPPYPEGWQAFAALRAALPTVAFVLTTINRRALAAAVGSVEAESIELFGKPFDLDAVCAAVRRALASGAASADGDEPR